jgi:hypothetical protein
MLFNELDPAVLAHCEQAHDLIEIAGTGGRGARRIARCA